MERAAVEGQHLLDIADRVTRQPKLVYIYIGEYGYI